MDSLSPFLSQRTWSISQDFKVFLQHPHHEIPWNDYRSKPHSYRSHKTLCHQGFAPSFLCQGGPLLRVCELLSQIHSQLFQYCHTNSSPHSQGPPLVLDQFSTEGLRLPAFYLLIHTCPLHPRCLLPLLTHDRCFLPCSWCSPDST